MLKTFNLVLAWVYWYKNGNLKPDMMSLFMAVDPCVKENGGLQVLVGSHIGGRIDHEFDGGQQGTDKERVEHVKKMYEHFYVNLQPGDGLFFLSLLLHSSGPNDSEQRRWAFNCSFNKKSNNPVKKHHHPFYTPLHKRSFCAKIRLYKKSVPNFRVDFFKFYTDVISADRSDKWTRLMEKDARRLS